MKDQLFNCALPFGKFAISGNIIGLKSRSQINYTISKITNYKTKYRRQNINTVIHEVSIDLNIKNKSKEL